MGILFLIDGRMYSRVAMMDGLGSLPRQPICSDSGTSKETPSVEDSTNSAVNCRSNVLTKHQTLPQMESDAVVSLFTEMYETISHRRVQNLSQQSSGEFEFPAMSEERSSFVGQSQSSMHLSSYSWNLDKSPAAEKHRPRSFGSFHELPDVSNNGISFAFLSH